VAAQRTGDFKPGAVNDGDVASHMMPEGDVVPAVQLEFPALDAFKDPAKRIGLLVLAFLFGGHDKCFLLKWNRFRVATNENQLKSWRDLNGVFGCLRAGKSGNQFAGSQEILSGAGCVSGHP
jgi:hypothetical protein